MEPMLRNMTYDQELMLSQKHAMTMRIATTTLDPQYPKVEREVTAKGVWTVAPTTALAVHQLTVSYRDQGVSGNSPSTLTV